MEDDEEDSSSVCSIKTEHESFENILTLIPARPHSLFPFQPKLARYSENLVPIDVRRRIFQQILDYIPSSQVPSAIPDRRWFDCTKPLLKLCQSSIHFVNTLSSALENLTSIKDQIFALVEQNPDSGDFNVLSSLLILLMELISQISWAHLTVKIEKRVKVDIEAIIVAFKKLMLRMDKIEETCHWLVKRCENIFERGPTYGIPPHTVLSLLTSQTTGESEAKIGLTQAKDLLVFDSEFRFHSLEVAVQLGMIYMLIQHIQQHLDGASSLAKATLKILSAKLAMQKWSGLGTTLSVFELGLFTKSKTLVQNRMTEVLELSLLLSIQTKFLYGLRESLKSARISLENIQQPKLPSNFVSFQVSVGNDKRFQGYVESGDWENETMASLVAQQYIIKRH